ncbi:MAG: hypothetical protein GWM98_14370 [Nitrospinaceae bacterium]|nr:hypothetical protein [Nitrospinaceae bacterium]NIR55440.1 hypothetical protein [Nitrospinaceae bacterium]NIS85880.1 hypothetical protein [Nitrospinaceae bacterium]NIT82724.1 hypothetical protein [Nitrospinaceae bacterium]NIU44933.1 hypothetical protein [Nitrospinaceae bacterium]
MKCTHPFRTYPITACLLALILCLTAGCASTSSKKLEQLGKVLRVYNNAFESKSENGGSMYVQNDYRMDYLLKYSEIKTKVSFHESQTLNHAYYRDGKPVSVNVEDPEKEFNEAVVTMRYQIAISPSNVLKNFIHDQHWHYENKMWLLKPNLDPFLK